MPSSFAVYAGHVIQIPRVSTTVTADISGMIDELGPCEVEFDLKTLNEEEALELAEQVKRQFMADITAN